MRVHAILVSSAVGAILFVGLASAPAFGATKGCGSPRPGEVGYPYYYTYGIHATNMSCGAAKRAIQRGSYSKTKKRYVSPGFQCSVIHASRVGTTVMGQTIRCRRSSMSFRFQWAT